MVQPSEEGNKTLASLLPGLKQHDDDGYRLYLGQPEKHKSRCKHTLPILKVVTPDKYSTFVF
jgi:hypothetical protein